MRKVTLSKLHPVHVEARSMRASAMGEIVVADHASHTQELAIWSNSSQLTWLWLQSPRPSRTQQRSGDH